MSGVRYSSTCGWGPAISVGEALGGAGVRRCYVCDAETLVMGTSRRWLEAGERQDRGGGWGLAVFGGRAVGTGEIPGETASVPFCAGAE